MSLATRCPACGTVFRVVQDQLRVSEGWVRCGRCEEVFSGLEGLFELTPATAAADTSAAAGDGEGAGAGDVARTCDVTLEALDTVGAAPRSAPGVNTHDDNFEPAYRPSPASLPASLPTQAVIGAAADLAGEPAVVARRVGPPTAPTITGGAGQPAPTQSFGNDDLVDQIRSSAPAFMAEAQRHARWRDSAMRPVLRFGALALLLLLAAQVVFEFRGYLAVRWPAMQGGLQQMCSWIGCSLPTPRQLSALTVESASLLREDARGSNRLEVALRNRGRGAVALPAVELSLNDEQGQVVARRVFTPMEIVDATGMAQSLGAGTEMPIKLPLSIEGNRVAGFSVEIFYP